VAERFLAWVVTGAPGRGFAFVINFSSGLVMMWRARRR
jgi:hypothetical protein